MRTLTLLFTLLLLTISIPTLLFLGFISLSFHWTSLLTFTVAGAIAFGLVLAVGASLNARFRRSLDDFTAGRTTDLTPSKGLLRVFGLLLVTLLPLLLYLLLFSVYAAAAFGLYGYWLVSLLPRIPVAILVGLAVVVLGTVYGFFVGLYRLVAPKRDGSIGVELEAAAQPELWRIARNTAQSVGTRAIQRIVLTPTPGVCVFQDGTLFAALTGRGRRVLEMGITSIHNLTVSEFSAILCHEYGHFTNRDTQWSAFTHAMGNSLVSSLRSTPGPMGGDGEKGLATLVMALNPGYWTLYAFVWLFFRVTNAFSRIREVMADIRAVRMFGAAAFAAGLRKVVQNDVTFGYVMDSSVIPALIERRETTRNFSTIMPKESDALGADLHTALAQAIADETSSPFDSHPPVALRLRYSEKLSGPTARDDRPITDLIRSWDRVSEEATEIYNAGILALLANVPLPPAADAASA